MTAVPPTNLVSNGAAGATNALRDIKPPVEIPSGWAWLMWLALVLLLLAAAWWAWSWWRRRNQQKPVVPEIPPHVRARQRLTRALALLEQPKQFCIEVSDIIRWYLEERFEFRAPERTTEEFLMELQGTSLLNAGQKESLGRFLQRCDMVKFAKYEPAEPELRELHAAAMRLLDETEPVIRAPGAHVADAAPAVDPAQEANEKQP